MGESRALAKQKNQKVTRVNLEILQYTITNCRRGWVKQGECGEYEGENMLNILYIPETKKINKI